MSADPQAIIYYGIRLASYDEYDDEAEQALFVRLDDDDHADEINERWLDEHSPIKPAGNDDYKSPAWDAWRARIREYESTPEHIEIAWSGASDCETYFVHCPCLEKSVLWHNQLALGRAPLMLAKADRLNAASQWLHKFCEQFNLPYSQPSWHLAARYF